MRVGLLLMVMLLVASCGQPQELQARLWPSRAAVGEVVTARLAGLDGSLVRVQVGGINAEVKAVSETSVSFAVPEVLAGSQQVEIMGGRGVARSSVEVLGLVDSQEVMVALRGISSIGVNASSRQVLAQQVERELGLRVRNLQLPLGSGPCSYLMATLYLDGRSVGATLAQLEASEMVYQADPVSLWDYDAEQPPQPVSQYVEAPASWGRGLEGKGVTVAVLDTGVWPHPELEGRLLQGYDFVAQDIFALDEFQPGGHGTPAAVLAAGSQTGVAPKANILPVRVCNERGQCRVSDAVRGICYALSRTNPEKLVVNLSMGGDTPSRLLEKVLNHAVSRGALVVTSAGNQGARGPRHYPAAHNIPGLVAVSALSQSLSGWAPARFSTWGDYVDLAAPGDAIASGAPGGGYLDYSGTSFAAPIVAGALALWREANPGSSPADIEKRLKQHTIPLPFPREAVGAGMLDLSEAPAP